MSDETVLRLTCFGIVVTLTPGPKQTVNPDTPPLMGGTITSDLEEPCDCDYADAGYCPPCAYNEAMNGIEALILGHACAGIDITTPAYLQGIESAVQGAADNI